MASVVKLNRRPADKFFSLALAKGLYIEDNGDKVDTSCQGERVNPLD